MRIASIDMGSNTILLLIAEVVNGKLKPVLNLYEAPRMSSDLTKFGKITEAKLNSVLEVLTKYKKIIEEHNCDITLVKATAGLRNAANKNWVLSEIKNKTGFEVELISGEKEAELTYLGAIANFKESESYCVIDIGGASTEIIHGTLTSVNFKESFPFGAVLLRDRFIDEYPVTDNRLDSLRSFLDDNFRKLKTKIDTNNLLPVAVAGTPTSLSALNMELESYDENLIEGSVLTTKQIEGLIGYMQPFKPAEILQKHKNIVKGREDILIVGSVILLSFLRTLELERIYVSGRGLRYGIIMDYLNKLK